MPVAASRDSKPILMNAMNWTTDQNDAIRIIDRNVLVSAGAGSGKTAVLAERCAHLVADLKPACRVDRLLVVTFTDAAAAEMRVRIAAALRQRLERKAGDRWLREQLALIDAAPISTLHAFCRRTLARHFAAAGVEPGFTLLDAHEAALLRDETAARLFEELSQGDDELCRAYDELRHVYGSGSDARIQEVVLELHAFLESQPDPAAWITAARTMGGTGVQGGTGVSPVPVAQGGTGVSPVSTSSRAPSRNQPPPAALNEYWRALRADMLAESLRDHIESAEEISRDFDGVRGPEPLVAYLREHLNAARAWLDTLTKGAVDDACRAIAEFQVPRLPARSKKVQALPEEELARFDAAQQAVRDLRTSFQDGIQRIDARFSEADWAEGLNRVAPHVGVILQLVETFARRYAGAKRSMGALDFSDLERAMLRLLRESPAVAAALRDRYEHVLVDEYQDINPVQAEILRHVSREAGANRPGNLFCVGDVKQSIYRFRLAEPDLFVRRRRDYEKPDATGRLIHLRENFRSRPAVLTAINRIMSRLMTDDLGGVTYDDRVALRAGLPDDPKGGPVDAAPIELHLLETDLPSDEAADASLDEAADASDAGDDTQPEALEWERIEREAIVIARRMRAMKHEDPAIAWRDMVILMRSPAGRAPLLARMLARLGVPVFAERSGGFFDALEVRDLRSLLSLLDNARQDIPLAAVLRSPLCAADGIDLPLSEAAMAAIRVFRRGVPFHVAAAEYARRGPDAALRATLAGLFARLSRWREQARRMPLADLIATLYADTAYPEYVLGLPDGPQRRANLAALHERARQFGRFARQGLYRFLAFLDELEQRGDDLSPGATRSAAANVVRVMSIHGAKGLEFPIVFLADVGTRFNLSDARRSIVFDRRLGLGLKAVDPQRRIVYPTLAHRAVIERIRRESLSEELRLLYVALTRAKRRLVIVGSAAAKRIDELDQARPRPPGPLPAAVRRRANAMLDWLIAAVGAEKSPSPRMGVQRHRLADLSLDEPRESAAASPFRDWPATAARLDPLPPPDGVDAARTAAAVTVARVGRDYAFVPLTRVPSVIAVSELKRRWTVLDDPDDPAADRAALGHAAPPIAPHVWRRPRFEGAAAAPMPTERGTWTHAFLQHVDLSGPCDEPDLRRQLDALIAAGRLTRDEAAIIDLESIAWFFAQPAGRALRQARQTVMRETPFVLGVDPARYQPGALRQSPGDVLVTRGMIDCLYRTDAGLVVLDWKTDLLTPDDVADRAAFYRPQLDIYAAAASALFDLPVATRRLVFLTPRRVVDV
ncbi:MAG: UvrD-helicase domain-containing protein [Phycisphaerae bacterium]|nr:UvrD-helicase domain-containing protein [Phycisphaerae bacterium]